MTDAMIPLPGGLRRGRTPLAPVLPRVFIVLLLLALGAFSYSGAQAQTTLVSNTGETTSGGGSSNFLAQSFTTGTAGEYTVTEVQIRIDDADAGEGTSAKIREDDNGEPGSLVATLTNPATLTGSDNLNTFTAPAGTTLDPGTTYWISVSEGVADRISYNTTNGNGQTGEAGWTIGDGALWRSDEAQDWNTTTGNLIIAIKGTITPLSTDATLSALALEDGDGNTVTVNPTFSSSTTAYYAWVDNDTDSVTLTATRNDDNATVAITDDDDTSTAGEADLDLDVGANSLEVTVTAEDTNTTATYTVTVVREAAAPTADPDALWTANLTAGQDNVLYTTFVSRWGFGLTDALAAPYGAVTDDDFETGGVTYEVKALAVSGPGTVGLVTTEQDKIRLCFASAPGAVADNWILHLGDDQYPLDDAAVTSNCYVWNRPSTLVWEIGDIVLVKLSLGNHAATGKPGIDGTPQVGQTLTATAGDMADRDDLPTTTFPTGYSFQWAKDGTDIPGETSQTYTVAAADVGTTIRVKVSFTDGGGNEETLTSNPTAAVIAAPGDCPTGNDWCATMTVGIVAVSTTFYGYNVEDVGTNVPRMGRLSDTSIDHAQSHTVGTIVFEDRSATDRFNILLDAFVPRGSVFDIGGTLLTVDVDAEDSTAGQYFWTTTTNPGWIKGQKVTVSANLAPVVTEAAVNGDQLTLTFAEDLDTNSKPAAGAFTLYIAGDTTGVNPSSVDSISGATVTMTLATAVTNGQTVTMDYEAPGTNPLRDESELGAPGFTGRTVTNNTPSATNNAATGKPGITGAPQRGGTLTATIGTIADDDGLTTRTFPGDYTFQWAKDGSDIAGATSSTYLVPATETLGATFTVAVSFTDDDGNAEGPLTSNATAGTVDAKEDCATDRADSDWCTTMTVGSKSSTIPPDTATATASVIRNSRRHHHRLRGRTRISSLIFSDSEQQHRQHQSGRLRAAGLGVRHRRHDIHGEMPVRTDNDGRPVSDGADLAATAAGSTARRSR